jgi:hypothetical protein
MHVSKPGYKSSAPYAADQSTPTTSDNRQNFAGRSPYTGAGLQTPVASPRPASPGALAALPPSPQPGPSSSGQTADPARKALVNRAYSEQAKEGRARAIDVAVMADIDKRAVNLRYYQTFAQNGFNGNTSGTYITRAGFTATQAVYVEKAYANEDWSRLVNDDNP